MKSQILWKAKQSHKNASNLFRYEKFLFSDTNITKHETYVATFINGDQNFQGRKCIYDYAGSKFSVIEVFLFND